MADFGAGVGVGHGWAARLAVYRRILASTLRHACLFGFKVCISATELATLTPAWLWCWLLDGPPRACLPSLVNLLAADDDLPSRGEASTGAVVAAAHEHATHPTCWFMPTAALCSQVGIDLRSQLVGDVTGVLAPSYYNALKMADKGISSQAGAHITEERKLKAPITATTV